MGASAFVLSKEWENECREYREEVKLVTHNRDGLPYFCKKVKVKEMSDQDSGKNRKEALIR
ncbi:hypothetical protein MACH08_30410 [Oceanobacillus kimchii]|uniref:Uncharacterized protein n=1 Tax=Oceanobacillus kimchii TaxID=746691 RepID=A0ABQ5TR97_9BACI|nr:hypothetical protein MACH08_30410 [Oceanobacillus kimchii]